MLIGIIRETSHNDNYYIHFDNTKSPNELTFIHTNEETIETLDKEQIRNLIKTILSSNLTYKEKYNDYDIYLDEANNKRYFKNGTEDFFMFIKNNGVSAIRYIEKIDKKENHYPRKYSIIVQSLVFEIIASTTLFIPLLGDPALNRKIDASLVCLNDIEVSELYDRINTSNKLSDSEKEMLCNEEYFKFLLDNTNSINRNYWLRYCMNDINIEYYEEEEEPNTNGYYSTSKSNVIHILNSIENNNTEYNHTLTHEFIHMTQDHNSSYDYILEACTEICNYEFYNHPIQSYKQQIIRTKILMEIIGPEPIIESIYSESSKSLKNEIHKYLPNDEANELLKLFKTSSEKMTNPDTDMNKIHTRIDELLAKMYYNKNNKNIENDTMINMIRNTDSYDRIYFNKYLEQYNEEFYLYSSREIIENIEISDIMKQDEIQEYSYTIEEEIINNGIKHKSVSVYTSKDFSEIPLDKAKIINALYKDGTIGYIKFNQKTGEWEQGEHYRFIKIYEPSMPKKFPEQIHNPIEYKPTYEKEQSEAKLI